MRGYRALVLATLASPSWWLSSARTCGSRTRASVAPTGRSATASRSRADADDLGMPRHGGEWATVIWPRPWVF